MRTIRSCIASAIYFIACLAFGLGWALAELIEGARDE